MERARRAEELVKVKDEAIEQVMWEMEQLRLRNSQAQEILEREMEVYAE